MDLADHEKRIRALEQHSAERAGLIDERITALTTGMTALQNELSMLRKAVYLAAGAWASIQFVGAAGVLRALGGH